MSNIPLPDLTLPTVKLGENETPWNLLPLLYKGGAKARINKVLNMIDKGELGPPLYERVEIVKKIHEEIQAMLVGGGSKETVKTLIEYIRDFFWWIDTTESTINLESVKDTYLRWTDHLLHRVRIKKDLSERTSYHAGRMVGKVLDGFLERNSPIILTTRLHKPSNKKLAIGVIADKQNIEETIKFGYLLLDIMDGLPYDKVFGSLPVHIPLRNGQELVEWSLLKPIAELRWNNPKNPQNRYYARAKAIPSRANYENDRTLRTRYPLVNMRIYAEMLFFIAQTGMNLAQAHQLKLKHYSYISSIDGYQVRDYKRRRQGEVLFEIFADYKAVFERYLSWRKAVFPNDPEGLLFPLVRKGARADDTTPTFAMIKRLCKKLGLNFISPSKLRKTRVNWLLRLSGDIDLTSAQAQHTKQTLVDIYEEPSLHRTMTEVVRYWQIADPSITPPAPGFCIGSPLAVKNKPQDATQPDCLSPSGCLWCEHHRDIDSMDYVWSISSFRHLKSLELAKYHQYKNGKQKNSPAFFAIERLSDKLRWFQQSNAIRKRWVEESLARIEEGDYHTDWCDLIAIEEGVF
jgi:hypothetical protein